MTQAESALDVPEVSAEADNGTADSETIESEDATGDSDASAKADNEPAGDASEEQES